MNVLTRKRISHTRKSGVEVEKNLRKIVHLLHHHPINLLEVRQQLVAKNRIVPKALSPLQRLVRQRNQKKTRRRKIKIEIEVNEEIRRKEKRMNQNNHHHNSRHQLVPVDKVNLPLQQFLLHRRPPHQITHHPQKVTILLLTTSE